MASGERDNSHQLLLCVALGGFMRDTEGGKDRGTEGVEDIRQFFLFAFELVVTEAVNVRVV